MRLFVALELPAAVRDNLASLLEELRSVAVEARDQRPRWVRAENLHVTLKFIGEAPAEDLDVLRNALAGVRSDGPVNITFRGLGLFPNEKHPRVFWAGLQASPNLPALASDVDRVLATQGIPPETRAFAAHLTLARFEPPGVSEKFRKAIQQNTARDFGTFTTREFHLIQSKTKSSGAEYTRLATFPFVTETAR